MAYDKFRFNENAGGMTSLGNLAFYDGSGPTSGSDTPGGDPLGTITANGYFNSAQEVIDAIARSVAPAGPVERGPLFNTGLLCLIRGNNGQQIGVLWNNNGTIQVHTGPSVLT